MKTNVLINNKVVFDVPAFCTVEEIHHTIEFTLVSPPPPT